MIFSRSLLRRQSLHGFATALVLNGMLASAAPPGWWSQGNYPIIDANAEANNHGVANIGQAKWMAKRALDSLRLILPDVADAIEVDLVGPTYPDEFGNPVVKPIKSWSLPSTPEEKEAQRAPLLIGQLKAIAAPFYDHLYAVAPQWVESERAYFGVTPAGKYPWTADPTDDSNKSVALIGQLKAVFSLDFAADRETGVDADGISDLWEWAVVNASTADSWTSIGQITSSTAGQAATDTGSSAPVQGTSDDYDGDGAWNESDADPWDPVVDWYPVPTTFYVTTVLGQFDYGELNIEPQPGSMWGFPESRNVTASISDSGLVLWNDMEPAPGSAYPWKHRSRAWKNGSWSGDLRAGGTLFDTFQFQTRYTYDDAVYPADQREITMTAQPAFHFDLLTAGMRLVQPQAVSGDEIVGVGDYSGLEEGLPQMSTVVVNDVPTRVVTHDCDVARSFHPVAIRWRYDLIAEKWRATPMHPPARTTFEYGDPNLNSDYDLSYWPRSLASPGGGQALIGGTRTKADRKWHISSGYNNIPLWTKTADTVGGYFSPELMDDRGSLVGRLYEGSTTSLQIVEGNAAQELPDSKWDDAVYAMGEVFSRESSPLVAGSKLWVRKGGVWKKTKRTPTNLPIMGVASNGLLLGPKAIWKNGYEVSLDELVQRPDLGVTPRFSNLRGYAMNSLGVILALADDKENSDVGKKTLLMLSPFGINGLNPNDLESISEYAGVDTTSSSDPVHFIARGYQPKPWIMVPNGGETWVRFYTTATADSNWEFDPIPNATNIRFTPESLEDGYLTVKIESDEGPFARGDLHIKIAGQPSVIPPIKILSMKRREVKVTLMPITSTYNKAKKEAYDDPPDYVPTAQQLADYLNEVYGRQVNARFVVNVAPAVVEWDRLEEANLLSDGSRTPGEAPITYGNRNLDYSSTLDERECLPPKDPNSQITVYVMGGCDDICSHVVKNKVYSREGDIIGVADPDTGRAWVRGDFNYGEMDYGKIIESLMNTIAHEIGHVVIDYGHPDEYASTGRNDPGIVGPAPLYPNWLDADARLRFYRKRLMSSGGITIDRSIRKQLVQTEWEFFSSWAASKGL